MILNCLDAIQRNKKKEKKKNKNIKTMIMGERIGMDYETEITF